MAKVYDGISPELADWIAAQHVFFVATAPLAADGHVNLSPRGLDCLSVLGPHRVAWVDLVGSGVETIAHLQENGRITLMWCAFEGQPKVVRLHGTGRVRYAGDPEHHEVAALHPAFKATRAVIDVEVERVSDSCGFGVPRLEYAGERDQLLQWADHRTEERIATYVAERNAVSLDGLPGL